MDKHLKIFIPLIILIVGGCATSKTTVYDVLKLQTITSWHIDFPPYKANANINYSARDLQLRDNIFFYLKDKHNIPIIKDINSAKGFIHINPVSGFYINSLDITMFDSENNLLTRTQIK